MLLIYSANTIGDHWIAELGGNILVNKEPILSWSILGQQ